MSEDGMKISRLIEILKKVQEKHGDIEVSKNGHSHWEGIHVETFVDEETGEFSEAHLTI
jgi:hypothetical protein